MYTTQKAKNLKKTLSEYFTKRSRIFWKRKKPTSKCYPFEVHDPFLVLEDSLSGYESFYLVGDNWIDKPELDIVLVLGCNDWKFGFIAEYLSDYRVAFAGRKEVGLTLVMQKLLKLKKKPIAVAIWGYTEKKSLRKALKLLRIPIWRIEDGFIRSASLGAKHTVPYSLVIDKTGLYYNGTSPSDLENILNNYDFKNDHRLISEAIELKKYLLKYKISKYNPPVYAHDNSIKLKKRVLVVGQVDGDASLKYGNPHNWSMEEMVKLAKFENPNAEVLYRPHPEVYEGYQKSSFRKKKIESFANIISTDEHIIELIERVDHVYTLTSLTGMDALLRGKTVTVLGTPFYSGWGLTDDRVNIDRRKRNLDLIELLAGSYILYPHYLANSDGFIGALSTIFKILSDRKNTRHTFFENKKTEMNLDCWFAVAGLIQTKDFSFLTQSMIEQLCDKTNHYYNEFFPIVFLSLTDNENDLNKIISYTGNVVNSNIQNNILLLLEEYRPGDYLISHWNKLFIQNSEYKAGKLNLDSKENLKKTHIPLDLTITDYDFEEKEEKFYSSLNFENFQIYLESKNKEKAKKYLNRILLSSEGDKKAHIKLCINYCNLFFEFETTRNITKVLRLLDIEYSNRYAVLENFRVNNFIPDSIDNIIESVADIATYKPDKIFYIELLLKQVYESIPYPLLESLKAIPYLDNEISIRKVNAFIALEDFKKAEKIARNLCSNNKITEDLLISYTQALSYVRKIEKAIFILEAFVKKSGLSKKTVTELLRLYVLNSDYRKSYHLLEQSIAKGFDIGEMHRRKCYFGNRLVEKAFESFKDLNIAKQIQVYFPNKYSDNKHELLYQNKVFILSIFGPGDEIRFASIYNKISNFLVGNQLYIACAPRLYNLFQSSFPEINFVKVEKPRNGELINLSNYTLLPGSDICTVIDNNAMSIINKVDGLTLVTSMLSEFITDYSSFEGSPYLRVMPELKCKYSTYLSGINILKIGISWRSGLTTSSRNEHYLSIQELEPIFSIPGIQFVNLQYDDCSEELDWINSKYPGKLLNIEELDQYNDFDGVAALMSCLDLVIAPATTVVELAGAIGVPTWLFSNSSEINWRKKDKENTDVWHNSITIVDIDEKGNKSKLVDKLYNKLQDFVENN